MPTRASKAKKCRFARFQHIAPTCRDKATETITAPINPNFNKYDLKSTVPFFIKQSADGDCIIKAVEPLCHIMHSISTPLTPTDKPSLY